MNKYFNKKRKGVGGLFFITCAIIGAYIVLTTIGIARAATAVAISDDVAHLVATKVAIEDYKLQRSTYEIDCTDDHCRVDTQDGAGYYPLVEFNDIMKEVGFLKGTSGKAHIKWTKGVGYARNGVAVVEIGPFTISNQSLGIIGDEIYPHVQEIVIEDR